MKRLLVAIVALLFFGGGVLALFWFGQYFSTYAFSRQELSIESPVPQTLSLGTPVVFDLHGSGFNRDTRVSMFMDVNNSRAVIGSFPLDGIYNECLLNGDYLYLARNNRGLQVLNIKRPKHPQLFKEYLPGRTITDIQRNDNYLFLCCGKMGVTIMQIQKDGSLNHVTDIALEATARKSQYANGFLFVAAGSAGLLVYDVRQPEQVVLVQIVRSGTSISMLTVAGDYLYLLLPGKQIVIYRVTEPSVPQLVGSLGLAATPLDLVADKGRLYVATESGVSLYALDDDKPPRFMFQLTGFGSARKFFVGSKNIYISDSFSGLRIIDPEVEVTPELINLNIDPRIVAETADHLFVAGSNRGLLIVEKNSLLSRQVVRTINTHGSARDLFIKDHWMYVADARAGVLLHDLNAGDAEFSTLTSRWSESLVVHGELLFVAEAKMGIEVFDISSPGQPEPVSSWPDIQAMRLAVADNYLLATKGVFGVELIDVSDIQHPVIKNVLPDIHALDIVSDGHFVYIASKNDGLLIYEILNGAEFRRLSAVLTPFPMNHFDNAISVEVQDGIAYVANGRSGLLIVDVSMPSKPVILSSVAVPGICKKVRVVKNKVFVASHHGGINIVNVENPRNPVLLNSIPMPGLSRGLLVVDDLIYAAQNELGVTVVSVPAPAEEITLVSEQQIKIRLLSPKFPGRYSLQISNCLQSVVSDGVVVYQ